MRITLRVLASALALALAACSAGTESTDPPTLSVRALPVASLTGGGEEVDLKVIATDPSGRPGKGTVTLTAPHGGFPGTDGGYLRTDAGVLVAITAVSLDSAGIGWTTFNCDVRKDGECHDVIKSGVSSGLVVRVTGTWATADASVTGGVNLTVSGCGIPDAGNAPITPHACAAATANECDGPTDSFLLGLGVPASRLNDTGGNGFDDDCDGLVDEGCECTGSGFSKDCWLVPATQVDADSGVPVGWCNPNARGAMSCQFVNGAGSWADDQGQPNCRGAQAPVVNDVCGDSDFNCDGLKGNDALQGCWCASGVQCPTTALTIAPYPDPTALPRINGLDWVPAASRSRVSNWTWTVLGGDCDNVLPNPTFALFAGPNTGTYAPMGTRKTVTFNSAALPPRYELDSTSPLAALYVTRADAGIYPAFALSGDYLVQGEFDLDGKRLACIQKVQVRAAGLRAELCWDTVGTVDIDLHMARLQQADGGVLQPADGGPPACPGAWFGEGCPDLDNYFGDVRPVWGYAVSDAGVCTGWASKGSPPCTNPRLDRDNISCNPTVVLPTGSGFCAPENINLDNPRDGDRFVVGAHYFGGVSLQSDGGAKVNHPHVNLYCNGERILSSGYNPLSGQVDFPAMITAGGDFWTVATVATTVDGGVLVACKVDVVPSRHGDPSRDGTTAFADAGTDFCVDSVANQTPPPFNFSYGSFYFVEARDAGQGLPAGYIPLSPLQWCKH